MYVFPFFGGEELKGAFRRFYENAYNGKESVARSNLDKVEELVVQRYSTSGRDPDKVRKKIKRIRGVLNQSISKKGKRRKLSKYVQELVDTMEEEEVGGDPFMALNRLKEEFSYEFTRFAGDRSQEKAQALKDILSRIEMLGERIEKEETRGVFRQLREKIGELKESISYSAGATGKVPDVGKEAKKFHRLANRVIELGTGAPAPTGEEEGEGEEEAAKNLSKEALKRMIEEEESGGQFTG